MHKEETKESVLSRMETARFLIERPRPLRRRSNYRYLKYDNDHGFVLMKNIQGVEHVLGTDEYWTKFKICVMSPVPTSNTICVDGSCINNGHRYSKGGFRIVEFDTNEVLYDSKIYTGVTNNLMEYMGLLKAILLCREYGWDRDVYTDSIIAMLWLYRKSENSRFKEWMEKEDLEELFALEDLVYCHGSDIATRVMFWDNLYFHEIPADLDDKFGKEDRDYQLFHFIEGGFAEGSVLRKKRSNKYDNYDHRGR